MPINSEDPDPGPMFDLACAGLSPVNMCLWSTLSDHNSFTESVCGSAGPSAVSMSVSFSLLPHCDLSNLRLRINPAYYHIPRKDIVSINGYFSLISLMLKFKKSKLTVESNN